MATENKVEEITEFPEQSACIRKYFNAENQKYYETTDKNFKWPTSE